MLSTSVHAVAKLHSVAEVESKHEELKRISPEHTETHDGDNIDVVTPVHGRRVLRSSSGRKSALSQTPSHGNISRLASKSPTTHSISPVPRRAMMSSTKSFPSDRNVSRDRVMSSSPKSSNLYNRNVSTVIRRRSMSQTEEADRPMSPDSALPGIIHLPHEDDISATHSPPVMQPVRLSMHSPTNAAMETHERYASAEKCESVTSSTLYNFGDAETHQTRQQVFDRFDFFDREGSMGVLQVVLAPFTFNFALSCHACLVCIILCLFMLGLGTWLRYISLFIGIAHMLLLVLYNIWCSNRVSSSETEQRSPSLVHDFSHEVHFSRTLTIHSETDSSSCCTRWEKTFTAMNYAFDTGSMEAQQRVPNRFSGTLILLTLLLYCYLLVTLIYMETSEFVVCARMFDKHDTPLSPEPAAFFNVSNRDYVRSKTFVDTNWGNVAIAERVSKVYNLLSSYGGRGFTTRSTTFGPCSQLTLDDVGQEYFFFPGGLKLEILFAYMDSNVSSAFYEDDVTGYLLTESSEMAPAMMSASFNSSDSTSTDASSFFSSSINTTSYDFTTMNDTDPCNNATVVNRESYECDFCNDKYLGYVFHVVKQRGIIFSDSTYLFDLVGGQYPVRAYCDFMIIASVFIIFLWGFTFVSLAWRESQNSLQYASAKVMKLKSSYPLLFTNHWSPVANTIAKSIIDDAQATSWVRFGCVILISAVLFPLLMVYEHTNEAIYTDFLGYEVVIILWIMLVLMCSFMMWICTSLLLFSFRRIHENLRIMAGLETIDLNFRDPHVVIFWLELRRLMLNTILPMNDGVSQWSVAACVISFFILSAYMVYAVAVWRDRVWRFFVFYALIVWIVVSLMLVVSFINVILRVWRNQKKHVGVLEHIIVRLRGVQAMFPGTYPGIKLLESVQLFINTYDVAPTILGITVSDSTFLLLKTYSVIILTTILSVMW